ncbi:hypothetical protein BASA50_009863 [Batrachochytrium salamandrivorans]|uniref:Uncharacterized protein n=1 Tax=Batrachochytrium salamandrivorans TaxID=1357716 RepID=A0ABQ8F036_9FUNG|nr:hypothetical protein BASA50_009863 [Batrachochytrium salamandrivorans]KAH9248790.1 hypothetical protein BASA81_013536 [Batrachochytrium salamandrivorans]KAH9269006.1 hypothetical protein BASA83_009008 [Batrachochytrium salamandrivorans]
MILPLLLLPLVSFGVVAQHPQRQQLKTAESSTQCPYTLVSPKTYFTPATYVCTGTSIEFQTNLAHRHLEDIERLCEETINLIEEEKCPPEAVIDDYNRHAAEYKRLGEEAKYAHKQWGLAVAHAKNGNGRNRSEEEKRRDRSSANQLGREFAQLDNEAKSKYRILIEKWEALEMMKKDCARKKKEMEKEYGEAITGLLKQYLRL